MTWQQLLTKTLTLSQMNATQVPAPSHRNAADSILACYAINIHIDAWAIFLGFKNSY